MNSNPFRKNNFSNFVFSKVFVIFLFFISNFCFTIHMTNLTEKSYYQINQTESWKSINVVLGCDKEFVSVRLELTAQGMVQYTNVQSQV